MYFPGKPAHQPEATMSKRVQSYWRKAEEAEVQTINQGSRSNGWFMNQESTSPVLGSSSEPPTRPQATPFPDRETMGPVPPPGSTEVGGITRVPLPARFSDAPTASVRRISRRSKPRQRGSLYASQFLQSPSNPTGTAAATLDNSEDGEGEHSTPRGLQGGRKRQGGSRTADSPPAKWESSPPPPPPPSAGTTTISSSSVSFQKLRSTFKLKPFSGGPADWSSFDEGLERHATIHGLGAVLLENYPTSDGFNFEQNQMFYYALQEALLEAPQALGFFKTAAKWDGHGAYVAVHHAYNFMGPTTAALLLKKLSNLRMTSSETPTALVMRLVELFDELEEVPGDAAYIFNDVQKIGHLQAAIAHEPDLKQMHMHIQTNLTRGHITFLEACTDLYAQCDDLRAQELLTNGGSGTKSTRALISTTVDSGLRALCVPF